VPPEYLYQCFILLHSAGSFVSVGSGREIEATIRRWDEASRRNLARCRELGAVTQIAIARIAFIARSRGSAATGRCEMMHLAIARTSTARCCLSGAWISLAFPREFICRLSYLDIELAPRPQVGVMLERTHEDHGGLGEIEMS